MFCVFVAFLFFPFDAHCMSLSLSTLCRCHSVYIVRFVSQACCVNELMIAWIRPIAWTSILYVYAWVYE